MRGMILGCLILLGCTSEVGAQFRPPVYRPPTPTYKPPVYRPTYQPPTYRPPGFQPSNPNVLPLGQERRNDPFDDGEPLRGTGGVAFADPVAEPNRAKAKGAEQPWTPPPAGTPVVVPQVPDNRAVLVQNPNRDLIPVAIGAVVLVVVVGMIFGLASAAPTPGRVRIVALPPGEAPEAVRQAWIGLELPTTSETPEVVPILGTETGKEFGALSCFTVDGATAIAALAQKDAEAAAWWTTNSPHTREPGFQLLFPAEVCEVVPTQS